MIIIMLTVRGRAIRSRGQTVDRTTVQSNKRRMKASADKIFLHTPHHIQGYYMRTSHIQSWLNMALLARLQMMDLKQSDQRRE
jgi:hypothetical protein